MSILTKIFSAGATELVKGVGSVIDNLHTSKDEKLAAELKIKELISSYEKDMERNVTDRWVSDNQSDNWMSKNIRPYSLAFIFICTIIMVFIDSGNIDFNVDDEWKGLLQIVLITMVGAFFGGRTFEKVTKVKKDNK